MKLIEAVSKYDLKLIKKLIKKGYPLNEKDEYGSTALIFASRRDYLEIAKELIKAGASINDKDNNGNTALLLATRYYFKGIMIELIKAGASICIKNYVDRIALDYNKEIWKSYEIQDLILDMYPDKYELLEEKVGIHKDILLKLKMKQILGV